MDREQRKMRGRRNQISLKNKVVIYWLAILGVIAIILLSYALNFNNTSKNNKKQSNISNFIISEADEDMESVSSTIGNTLEETKQNEKIEEEIKQTSEEVIEESVVNKENKLENESNSKNVNEEVKTNVQTIVEKNEKKVSFVKPVEGSIIKEFAKEKLVYSETLKEWITHNGIDIAASKTTVIKSAADGIIKSIKNDPRYGLTVIIAHDDNYETIYSNLLTAEFIVEDERITAGQSIGTVGNSGSFESSDEPHLHFEIIKDGEYVDPSIYIKW